MKLKKGEQAIVISGLVQNKLYGSAFWDAQDGMGRFVGKVMTVDSVYEDKYRMLEDGGEWAWTDDMLEPVSKREKGLSALMSDMHLGAAVMPFYGGFRGGKSWLGELLSLRGAITKDYQTHVLGEWKPKPYGECGNAELLNKLGIEKVVFSKKLGRAITIVRLTDGREGKATQAVNDEPDWMIGFGQAYFKALVGKERIKTLVGWIEKKGVYIKGGEKK
jgi:hypothetical protein